MYFIKYQPLKEQLRHRTFSDRDGLPYYIIYVVSTLLMLNLSWGVYNKFDALSATIGSAATIWGILYTFKKNGGKQGYDFIQKSIVLGWIVIMRCLLPFLFIGGAVGYFSKVALGQPIDETTWVDVGIYTIFLAIYFHRLGRHIADTSGNISEQFAPVDAE